MIRNLSKIVSNHNISIKWIQYFSSQTTHFFVSENSQFSSFFYGSSLQKCIKNDDFITAYALHCQILKKGNCLDLFAYNILLNLYVKSSSVFDAVKMFNEMPERNTVSFVTLIQGYASSFCYVEAMHLFMRLHREGFEINPFVLTSVLKLLVEMDFADLGFVVHGFILKLGFGCNVFVGTGLIDAYSVCGSVACANRVFDGIGVKDMVLWTGMVTCYAENEQFVESLKLFSEMRMAGFSPNNFTFVSVLKAFLGLQAFEFGKGLHGCVLKTCYERDVYVGIGLLDLYTTSGALDDAMSVFEEMPKKDVIPWSFMIARHAQGDRSREALELFSRMREASVVPNQFTFSSVLQACARVEALELGKQIHCNVLKTGLGSDIFVCNALMDVYAKCGRMENSMELFIESLNKSDVTWNTMIVGFVQSGDGEKALSFFQSMLESQVQATEVTYSSVLRACASLAALEPGVQIHSLTVKTNYFDEPVVSNALIDMYAKCGRINDARLVFDMMSKQNEVSWNTMISGYSMHGLGEEALNIFEIMLDSGCRPNELTFIGVLSACSNAGLLERGKAYYKSMVEEHGIEPCSEHYSCMVWLLGRSGHLDEAVKLIEEVPLEPSVMAWRALLGACLIHNNIELGKMSAQRVLDIDPQDEATHVLLSNMYAGARSWNDVASVRKSMKKKGVKKEPGLSWIENHGTVHYFSVGDTSHPDKKLIMVMLEWLKMKTRKVGYVPNLNAVLLDVEDDDKERRLWAHSERLALAFALIRTPSTSHVRIIKNLRICADCHAVIKLVSKIVQRDIIIRDLNRFHHFQNGVCSCGDYW